MQTYVIYGTLVAALVAAFAAVWSAIVSHLQYRATTRASERPKPLVQATASAVEGQPDWTHLLIQIDNRADTPIDALQLEVLAPTGIRLLEASRAFDQSTPFDPVLLRPLPQAEARAAVPINVTVELPGARDFNGGRRDRVHINAYAHCPPSRFLDDPDPRLEINMRWRDHAATTFAMAAKVIKPNRM